MLIRTSELKNYVLEATDGEIGRCRDFLFDEEHWTVRYVEVGVGKWLFGRRVLISPASLESPNVRERSLAVKPTKVDIRSGPEIEHDQPVSRQYEVAHARHFGLGHYWIGGGVWGAGPRPRDILSRMEGSGEGASDGVPSERPLRSAEAVSGYKTHAIDGDIGVVTDLIVDTESWSIIFLAIDTRRWLPGRKVLLPVAWVSDISWPDRKFDVDATKRAIETAPELEEPITEGAVIEFYSHFGKSQG